jgi:methylenetetrahydrofolate reductase (NADPH)
MNSRPQCSVEPSASALPAPDGASVPALLRDFSIEITPREALALPDLAAHLPRGTAVYLPYLPRVAFTDTVAAARALRDAGFAPVAHVAARAVANAQALRGMLTALTEEAGVARLLLVGGDLPEPRGPYASVMDILRTDALARHGIREVAFAGYPEGHPGIPDATLAAAVRDKLAMAALGGLRVRWLTQLCFVASPVAAWTRRLRVLAPAAHVDAGVYGVTALRALVRYGRLCGVGASLRALLREPRHVFPLHGVREPLRMVEELADLRRTDPLDAPSRVHFFSLGAFAATAAWANAVARGAGGAA